MSKKERFNTRVAQRHVFWGYPDICPSMSKTSRYTTRVSQRLNTPLAPWMLRVSRRRARQREEGYPPSVNICGEALGSPACEASCKGNVPRDDHTHLGGGKKIPLNTARIAIANFSTGSVWTGTGFSKIHVITGLSRIPWNPAGFSQREKSREKP